MSVLKLAANQRLPFDWRVTVAGLSATLDGYQAAAGKRIDFAPAKDAIAALGQRLDRFHAAAGAMDAGRANHVVQRLARILVPLNYTRDPRFDHDPALAVPPLPVLSAASELDGLEEVRRGFARAQLVRGQNRVVAAMDEACRLVDSALA